MRTEQNIRNDLELVTANLLAATEKEDAITYIEELGDLIKELKEFLEQ